MKNKIVLFILCSILLVGCATKDNTKINEKSNTVDIKVEPVKDK